MNTKIRSVDTLWQMLETVSMTDEGSFPVLVIAALEEGQPLRGLLVKGGVSSLMRSLFSGNLLVFRNSEMPLFKVERTQLNEIVVPSLARAGGERNSRSRASCQALAELVVPAGLAPRRWVIVVDAASLALRNIDHLVPMDLSGPFCPPEIDFYWATRGCGNGVHSSANPGIWAVRVEHLPLVIRCWEKLLESGLSSTDEEIWTRVVSDLPLRKKLFEKGEVVSPRIGEVDWTAVSNAAFVTLPDWPDQEAWKFLQSLYFGTFLGDETGMLLHVLEA